MRGIYEEVAKDDTRKVSIEIRLFPMGEEASQQEFKQRVSYHSQKRDAFKGVRLLAGSLV